MNAGITILIALVVTAIIVVTTRIESKIREKNSNIYYYSIGVKIIFTIAIILLPIGYVIEVNREHIQDAWDTILYLVVSLFFLFMWMYVLLSKIIIDEKFIEKITPFWRTKIPYREIDKIDIRHSMGNPGAAMTRVYGKKKIILEVYISGYEELLNELTFRCENATILEK